MRCAADGTGGMTHRAERWERAPGRSAGRRVHPVCNGRDGDESLASCRTAQVTLVSALIAYAVKGRTREMGIRLALGARPADVVRLLVLEGALLGAAGVALGIPGALLWTRVLSSQLFSVTPTDPLTFVGVAGILALVTVAAAYLPARAAARVNPLTALRRG